MQNRVNGEKRVNFFHIVTVLQIQEWNLFIVIGNSIEMLVQCSVLARMLSFIRRALVKNKNLNQKTNPVFLLNLRWNKKDLLYSV